MSFETEEPHHRFPRAARGNGADLTKSPDFPRTPLTRPQNASIGSNSYTDFKWGSVISAEGYNKFFPEKAYTDKWGGGVARHLKEPLVQVLRVGYLQLHAPPAVVFVHLADLSADGMDDRRQDQTKHVKDTLAPCVVVLNAAPSTTQPL